MIQWKKFSKSKTNKQSIGSYHEKLAAKFLLDKGLHLIQSNYFCKAGEIDLIMSDKSQLVFVEVRYRYKSNFGSALESVTASKQRKLRLCAQHYLLVKGLTNKVACRFDVIGIEAGSEDEGNEFQWVPNAFY